MFACVGAGGDVPDRLVAASKRFNVAHESRGVNIQNVRAERVPAGHEPAETAARAALTERVAAWDALELDPIEGLVSRPGGGYACDS